MSRCVPESSSSDHESPLLRLDNQVCFPLYSAANAIIRTYRPLLDELDLTYAQYLTMMVLWEQNGISVKALGEKLHLDSGTLTPLLKRLEAKGYVERKRSESDERIRVLLLTEQGEQLKLRAVNVPEQMVCQFGLDVDEMLQLKALCLKVLKNFGV